MAKVPEEIVVERDGPVYVLTPAEFGENGTEDGISLMHYINVLIRRRWFIVGICFFAVAAAYVFSKLSPKEYQATATFLLAEKTGTVIGEQEDSLFTALKNPGEYYKKVAVSSTILDPLLKEVALPDPKTGNTSTLMEIWKVEGDNEEDRVLKGRESLAKRIEINNPRDFPNILTLTVTAESPRLAADLANNLIDRLSKFDVTLRSSSAKQRTGFIQTQLAATEAKLKVAEARLQQFLERNRVVPAYLQVERGRLEREVELNKDLFLTLRKELELAQLSERKESSAISIIDKASPPRYRSKPKTLMNMALAGVVGLMFAVFAAFVLEFLAKAASDRRRNLELAEAIEALRGDLRKAAFWRRQIPAKNP